MKHIAVVSTNILSIGYDEKAQILEVQFKSNSVYQYKRIPVILYKQLMEAKSKGQFFSKTIRNNPDFPCSLINNWSPDVVEAIRKREIKLPDVTKNVGIIPDEKLKNVGYGVMEDERLKKND